MVAAAPSPEAVPAPPSVLEPPADMKTIIDKTATFVARNGPEFEARIMNDSNNAKFAFLKAADPYNAYYRAKVVEMGGQPAGAAVTASATSATTDAAAVVTKKAPTVEPVEPPRLLHVGVKPVGAAPLDTDVIQLTAQFVAANGRSFLTGIANRESKNPQFDFLRPTHHLFTHFTQLVDAYSKCLAPANGLKASLQSDAEDPLR